jgi:hypothetical protein
MSSNPLSSSGESANSRVPCRRKIGGKVPARGPWANIARQGASA